MSKRKLLVIVMLVGAGFVVAGIIGRPPPPAPADLSAWHGQRGSAKPLARANPVRITIPSIDVDADVVPTKAKHDGQIEAPPTDTPWKASWYENGPSPGEAGAAVIIGHVDSRLTGKAVFYELGRLRPGQRFSITRDDTSVADFRVDKVRSYAKKNLPIKEIFGSQPYPALRLITCGGTYDANAGGYQSNVVVYATMVKVEHPGFFG